MIDFACICGQTFSLPAEKAGTEFQCPRCHRLVDVPTLSELPGLKPDGTYEMDVDDRDPELLHQRFGDFVQAFGREKHDEDGFEKDLRLNDSQLGNVGVPAVDGSGRARLPPPKYDPVTGELLRPIELAPVPVRPVQALPEVYQQAGTTLSYAAAVDVAGNLKWRSVWLQLFTAPNMMVMFFPFACHMFMQLCVLIIFYMFPVGGLFLAGIALLAHYGAIPTSIGTEDKDELPRPLGSLNWHEDLWGPFCNMTGSLLICYAPPYVAIRRFGFSPEGVFIGGSLATCGTLIFPAVLLTMTTSGTMLNLRPDRVLSVVRVAGLYYLGLVLEWVAAVSIYTASLLLLHGISTRIIFVGNLKAIWGLPVMLGLILGIYLMHAFLWHVGLLYRGKGAAFPWVLQQYTRRHPRVKFGVDPSRANGRGRVKQKYV